MEAQRLLDMAPFSPDIVKLLKRVFDETWASIALTTAADRASNTRLSYRLWSYRRFLVTA